jgi:hypothetical protein
MSSVREASYSFFLCFWHCNSRLRRTAAAQSASVTLVGGHGVRQRSVELVGSHGEVETPLPSNSPHDHMILRAELVDSHGRRKCPCHQTRLMV